MVGSPPTTIAFSGYTVLCAAHDGSVSEAHHGLFHRDTRVLSRYRLTVDDAIPELVSDCKPENDRWEAVLRVPRPGGRPEGPLLPQDALEVQIRRRVGPGMLEYLTVRNHSALPFEATLRIEVDGDFADVAELGRRREQQGPIERTPEREDRALRLDYAVEQDGRRVLRGLRLQVIDASSSPQIDANGFRFALRLEAGGQWQATLRLTPLGAGAWPAPESLDHDVRARQRGAWRDRRPTIECAEPLRSPFERAADDLFDLRNWELEERFLGKTDGAGWILNAGVPTFTVLFGRDIVTAGWQSSMLGPRAARGGLEAVASTQAQDDDPWRDAEPGKLIHELRSGPLSELDSIPGMPTTAPRRRRRCSCSPSASSGTGPATPICCVATATSRCGRSNGPEHTGTHGDGFLEYERRSPRGLRNQGWKDSDEAIRYPDGTIVSGPIATVEEQAFHFLAMERMGEILVALGEDPLAERLLERAADLRYRWHDAYWMEDEGFYALALDGAKEQVRSIASNPGHALGAGIVPAAHARAVADRLLAPDLFSGWGVRSLSDRHPSYNPFAYHLGALWPVEQATFALGFKRYGLDEHVDRLVEAVFDAAFRSPDGRLPEAQSGHGRDRVSAPVPYPKANSPQAGRRARSSSSSRSCWVSIRLRPFTCSRSFVLGCRRGYPS